MWDAGARSMKYMTNIGHTFTQGGLCWEMAFTSCIWFSKQNMMKHFVDFSEVNHDLDL